MIFLKFGATNSSNIPGHAQEWSDTLIFGNSPRKHSTLLWQAFQAPMFLYEMNFWMPT